MKKIIIAMFCMVFCLAISLPAWSVEISEEAVEAGRVPASYATVKDGEVVFGQSPIAYSGESWDKILTAYGGTLSPDAKLPASYATVEDGEVVFGKTATSYSPDVTHEILTGYGFITTPNAMAELKDPATYAKVEDGVIVFGKIATAYSPEEFNMLMAAYQLPRKEVVAPVRKAPPVAIIPEKCPDADGDGVCDDKDKCPGTPEGVKVDERGCWVIEGLRFDFDESVIKPGYYPSLNDVVRVMEENPDLEVEIRGHTCDIGTDSYNQKLSERRAKAVFDYLSNKGIDAKRLSWKGFGEKQPAYPNTTEGNRAKNRRVELERSR